MAERSRAPLRIDTPYGTWAANAIAVVEASYAFAGDDRAWLAGVSTAAKPLLDAGGGIVAYFYDLRRPVDGQLTPPLTFDTSDDFARTLVAVHGKRSARDRERPYVRPAAFVTSSQLYGPRATASDPGARESAARGYADFARVCAAAGERHGCVVGAPLVALSHVGRADAARWEKLTSHVAAALRLRRALATPGAIFDAAGKVHHAHEDAPIDRLRRAAAAIDRARTRRVRRDPDAALSLWNAVVAGRWTLIDRFDRDGRRFWIAHENTELDPRGLSRRERAVAAHLARGLSNKQIAGALGISEGTVAAHAAGIRRKVGDVPRAELARRVGAPPRARVNRWLVEGERLAVVSKENDPIPDALTPAEREVARLVADGASNAEVADRRRTSIHTVVNQLQRVYEKLGVRSRVELARRLDG